MTTTWMRSAADALIPSDFSPKQEVRRLCPHQHTQRAWCVPEFPKDINTGDISSVPGQAVGPDPIATGSLLLRPRWAFFEGPPPRLLPPGFCWHCVG